MSFLYFTILLLLSLVAGSQAQCDFTIGSFQTDVLTHVGIARDFFKKEGIENLCITQVFSSIAAYDALLAGTIDTLHAAFDNTYVRRVARDPPVMVSIIASTDLGAGLVALAHDSIPSLADLDGKIYAADAPSTGFIPLAYEMARLSGVDLSTLTNNSGFNDDTRLAMVDGAVVSGKTGDWAMFSLLWGIPDYYEPIHPNVHEIGKMEDYVWPLQAGCWSARSDAQDNPASFDKLRRFFRAQLRAYKFASKKSNRNRVIKIIEERRNLTKSLATEIYDRTIGRIRKLTGVSPFLVPNKRGIFNVGQLRFDQGTGPAPGLVDLTPSAGGLVDLRALEAAFDDEDLGSAIECYDDPEEDDCI